jgi:hypothetical protein
VADDTCSGCIVAAQAGSDRVRCSVHYRRPPDMITWDHRDQIDLEELARIVDTRSRGVVRITPVDTGDDQYAIAIHDDWLTPADATAAYRALITGEAQ